MSWKYLSQTIQNQKVLQQKVAAWAANRNAKYATVNWRFTSNDARY